MMEEYTYQNLLKMASDMKQELRMVQEELCRYVKNQDHCHDHGLMDSMQLMAYLHISKRKLADMRQKGEIPYYKLARKIYYKKAEIDALLKKSSIQPEGMK